jgi:molybdopterin-containing oxidoreductase family membrane subunit
METFMAWYSGNLYEMFEVMNRAFGPYAWVYWVVISCNVLAPQSLWVSQVRSSPAVLFLLALIVNVGMWLERFMIVVVSLHRDFMPSAWGFYTPTIWDWSTFVGTIGLFLALFFVFIRLLPVISIFELRELVAKPE